MTSTHARRRTVALTSFLLACAGVFAYLYSIAGGTLPLKGDAYQVRVLVPDAFQLVPNSDVRTAGVKVGSVKDVAPQGGASLVRIELDDEHAPVHRDARVRVRTKTLVGENYLEVVPGRPGTGAVADGGVLPLERADEAVQLDKILSTLDGPTRAHVKRNLDGLGRGLRGRGKDVNELFAAVTPTVSRGGVIAGVLDGQRRAFAATVQHTGQVLQVFGDRSAAVRRLATQARRAATAAASRDRHLQAAIEELPGTLHQAGRTSGEFGRFAGTATPVLSDLRRATDTLRPVVRDLGPTAVDARRLFARLPAFLRRADPLLAGLRTFATEGLPAAPALDELLGRMEPFVRFMARYDRELGAFFGAVGSTTDVTDAVGNYLRVQQYYSPTSLSGFTPEMRRALDALTDVGLVRPYVGEGRNAYPAPGSLADPEPFSGDLPEITATPARG